MVSERHRVAIVARHIGFSDAPLKYHIASQPVQYPFVYLASTHMLLHEVDISLCPDAPRVFYPIPLFALNYSAFTFHYEAVLYNDVNVWASHVPYRATLLRFSLSTFNETSCVTISFSLFAFCLEN